MSDPRIALIAEGPTDAVLIEAALRAILRRPFVLNQLQPEPTRPEIPGGWCGVYKWCQEFRQRGAANFESDPLLKDFDLIIVHLDADVADKKYDDCGAAITQDARAFLDLPCAHPCPPASDSVKALTAVLLSWLSLRAVGHKTILCIPSKATDTWLATVVLPDAHPDHAHIECTPLIENQLAGLPKGQRIHKNRREYQNNASTLTARWGFVTTRCTQAALFEHQLHTIAQTFPA